VETISVAGNIWGIAMHRYGYWIFGATAAALGLLEMGLHTPGGLAGMDGIAALTILLSERVRPPARHRTLSMACLFAAAALILGAAVLAVEAGLSSWLVVIHAGLGITLSLFTIYRVVDTDEVPSARPFASRPLPASPWQSKLPCTQDVDSQERPTVLDLFPEINFQSRLPATEGARYFFCDEHIREAILIQLRLHPRAIHERVRIEVSHGKVVLRGSVGCAADRRLVRAIAITTDGVSEVNDQMVITSIRAA
jgi:hypothetical protein